MINTMELAQDAIVDSTPVYGDLVAAAINGTKVMPMLWLFEEENFQGRAFLTSLSYSWVGDSMNDMFRSAVVVSGEFEFFADRDYSGETGGKRGPGYYSTTATMGIHTDSLSSFKAWII